MLWKNPRPRKSSGSGEGQGSDPAHASELLIAGSSPGCPVVCIPGADFQAGLPWCLSLATLHQSGCSAFHPVPPVRLGLHSCLSHPPQGKAAHSFPQHPSGADLPRTQSELLKIERELLKSEIFIYEDRQTKKNHWTFEGSLSPKNGPRWTRWASGHREGEIYIRKKTFKKILIGILTKTSKTVASIKQKHDFQILKPSRGIE